MIALELQHDAPVMVMKPTVLILYLVILFLSSCSWNTEGNSNEPTEQPSSRFVEFQMKKMCMELGQRLFEAEFNKPTKGQMVHTPLYTYSNERNSCVMYTGYSSKEVASESLIDVLSNQEFAHHGKVGNESIGLTRIEFNELKHKYFAASATDR